MLPRVSFVIPVRDDAARLGRCLESIKRNQYPWELVEVIVVDNGSTDDSAQVARRHGAIVLRSNGRVAELRNHGAQAALGGILAFVDSDHEIDDRWIPTAVDVLSVGGVGAAGAPYIAPPAANWVQQSYDNLRARPVARQDVDWLASGNLAVNRKPFDLLGGFDRSLEACEDVDLCNRLRLAGLRIVAEPGLRSVHFGDPATLRALFFGELWRGRDNARVTLRGPRTFRHFRSVLIPMANLGAVACGAIALAVSLPIVAAVAGSVVLALAAIKVCRMARRHRPTIVRAAQAFVVAVIFDLARAFALLLRGSHRARRAA
jgi:glycosyltransferase involved in cell wall biosynthesis